MKCEDVEREISLAAYGELSESEYRELAEHLAGCSRCQGEFDSVQALQQALALHPAVEPSANLLASTRMRLDQLLDETTPVHWWTRLMQSPQGALSLFGRAPARASLLLAFGFFAGGLSGYRMAQRAPQAPASAPAPQRIAIVAEKLDAPSEIADVSSIRQEPNSENVEVEFKRLVPETIRGSLDDPQIRQLLVLAAENRTDPGIQQNSLSLLADECKAGHQCADGPVRKALLVALRYDQSPEVRLKALNGLEPYVGEDMRVRDAILEALMKDPDAAVRSRAIEMLEPVQDDSSVREVLHTVASEDDNPYIRTVSREVLDQLPQIQ